MKASYVKDVFRSLYNSDANIYIAPGRINLIGEHTDYNDGFVLPAAIDKHVIYGLKENGLNIYRFHAIDLEESFEAEVGQLHHSDKGWPNYLMGVIDQLNKTGNDIPGFDCVVTSDIPIGAGLSSSAALETGLATGLNDIYGLKIQKLDLVKLSQKAENEFVGVNCGIMDQFASVFGKSGHVFRLDCRSLEYEYFPLNLNGNNIILVDTKVKHSLGTSEYNTRRQECEQGLKLVAEGNEQVKSLRDVSRDILEAERNRFDPVVYKRCDYVIGEIDRVQQACKDLLAGRIEDFGEKMYETHEGLSKDYEVSCEELDFLVDFAKDNQDVLGSRMMGGGFGGCTISIIKEATLISFKENIANAFHARFGHPPLFYDVKIDDGVRRFKE